MNTGIRSLLVSLLCAASIVGQEVVRRGTQIVRTKVKLERATWRDEKLRVPVQARRDQIEVFRANGANWSAAPQTITAARDKIEVAIPVNQLFMVRTDRGAKLNLTKKTYLPIQFLYCKRNADGTTDGSGWVPFLGIRPAPATWKDTAYATELVVGVDATFEGQPESLWPGPITIQLFPKGASVAIDKTSLVVSEAGVTGYRSANVSCARHDSEPEIEARLDGLGSTTLTFDLLRTLSELRLELDHRSILGFGLQSATLRVTRLADDGQPWADTKPLEVALTGEGSFPAALTIPAGAASASGTVRSRSVGRAKIGVSGGPATPVEIDFRWPTALLIISVILGAIGGLLRHLLLRRKAAATGSPEPDRNLALDAFVGAIAGPVAVVAAAVGILAVGVPPADVLAEALTGLLALIAGYSGTAVFDKLAAMFGLAPKEAKP